MNLFDKLVQQAMSARPELATVRPVVEKELLHHDILREMNAAGLLAGLTFIGGTCLRACYGSPRLSEDLDFAGGRDFTREMLGGLGRILVEKLEKKYALETQVSEPVKETIGVDTWKLTIVTRPDRKDLPVQRIHIDICAVPSYDSRPMMLRNVYGVEMGTSGLIIRAQSRQEILADKILALAFRPHRLKNRDLWDITWLKQQGIDTPFSMIPAKIIDHGRNASEFAALVRARCASLKDDRSVRTEFLDEMRRFLPAQVVTDTVEKDEFWKYLADLVHGEGKLAAAAAKSRR